jgi:hypothetical protein
MFKRSSKPASLPQSQTRHGVEVNDPHCLQLSSLLKRAASGSSAGLPDMVHAARATCLEQELEAERQRHAETAACLTQEQEMLAILAARLAAVETVAETSSCDVVQLQQELQEEQQLHDIALRSLMQLRTAHQSLQLHIASLSAVSSSSTGTNSSTAMRASLRARLAFKATCLACGAAAAAVLQASVVPPPAVVALAWPALTAMLAANTTAALLHGIGRLCRKAVHASTGAQQHTAQLQVAISTAATSPASFNCWEQGDVFIPQAESSTTSSSVDTEYLASTVEYLYAPIIQSDVVGVICAWDDVDSVCGLQPWSSTDSSSCISSCISISSGNGSSRSCSSIEDISIEDNAASCGSNYSSVSGSSDSQPVDCSPVPATPEPESTPSSALAAAEALATSGAGGSVQCSTEQQGCHAYARSWVLETVHEGC